MGMGHSKKMVRVVVAAAAVLIVIGMIFYFGRQRPDTGGQTNTRPPVPVEAVLIERGEIALRRFFSGELEALAEFVVAPKVGGRVERVMVSIADSVVRGQVVAELDNDEYVQAVTQARADLSVAQARLAEAESALVVGQREFKRTASLVKRGIASDSEFDAASQDNLAKQAQFAVAEALVAKAASSLETANIRLGYTNVIAGWTDGGEHRVVAERYVDEGQTVAANAPLLLIVELHPIVGIFYVTERDYAYLSPGQPVELQTDAYPGERFAGRIDRIAPIFVRSTRQARVEMTIDNPEHRLKPGMFIRAAVVLKRASDATIVPEQALVRRDDRSGVFVVGADGRSVSWREVIVGIRDNGRAQVQAEGLSGRVVTLGQQLVRDGSLIVLPNHNGKNTSAPVIIESP